jgi:ABC-type uncharacterized transport system substrate-binding protein
MKTKTTYLIATINIILAIAIATTIYTNIHSPYKITENKTIKILHINSYTYDFSLVQKNIEAFKQYFQEQKIPIEIETIEMNTLANETQQNIETKIQETLKKIETYQPDLIYATDDPAQKYIVKPHLLNSKTPIVFSGINENITTYNYQNAKNIAGVYEKMHLTETIELLTQIFPNTQKIVAIYDDYPQWENVVTEFKQTKLPEKIKITWEKYQTLQEYKTKTLQHQNNKTDAILIIGITNLENETGQHEPLTEIIKWNTQNLNIPDATFWDFLIVDGAALAAQISDKAQGRTAAAIAKKILIDGELPKNIEITHTTEVEKYINTKRLQTLNISLQNIPSTTLINTNTIDNFAWEENNETP